jgi:hypothetical protein
MKFLTISTFKDARLSLPPDEKQKLDIADVEYLLNMKKKMGDKWNFYTLVGWNRYISIGDYNSVEEYNQTLQGPSMLAGYSNTESYPLIEMDLNQVEDYLKQVKAAK